MKSEESEIIGGLMAATFYIEAAYDFKCVSLITKLVILLRLYIMCFLSVCFWFISYESTDFGNVSQFDGAVTWDETLC